MELFPAIDLKDGQVVRLTQGDFDRLTIYDSDPAGMAERFKAQGAKNLHLVDLDGAKGGTPANLESIRRLLAAGGLFVEIGGGIRDMLSVERYLELGVGRVILGTAAVEDFGFLTQAVREYGDKIAVGVDARDGKVATRGWQRDSGLDALEFCKRLEGAGIRTIIFTDISRDGMMKGVNLEAYRRLGKEVSCDIIASGGVSSADDIAALAKLPVYGAIVGKALYEGTLDLKELLGLC